MGELTTLDHGGPPSVRNTDIAAVEARESQRIQGMIVSAKRCPRDEDGAFKGIMRACGRPTLAEVAMYAYPRGGQTVTGPSIRLAEVLKQNWGNMVSGIREVERLPGGSKMYAYAWDLQSNALEEVEFYVAHVRDTKKGRVQLHDERDIYELIANQGKRRERACILATIPGDIVEAAVAACKETTAKSVDLNTSVPKMLKAFEEFDVSKEQIELRIRKKITSITPAEFVQLRAIYQSLKDGASKPEDWFEAIHDPKKITRESEAAAVDANKESAALEKAQAWKKYQELSKKFAAAGGDPYAVVKLTTEELSKRDAAAIMAAVDLLEKGLEA